MTRLHLVRHGRPLPIQGVPADAWDLDPAGFDEVWALRGRLPTDATWYSSPEPKAVATAQLLTEGEVGIVEGLREHVRDSTEWIEDFPAVVRRAFAESDLTAHPGWEPLSACRDRVLRSAGGILEAHAGEDVVMVGHGTAWTLLAAEVTGQAPDLDRWATLQMPDVIVVDE